VRELWIVIVATEGENVVEAGKSKSETLTAVFLIIGYFSPLLLITFCSLLPAAITAV